MREAAADELIAATDVADLLVRLGMPFREAHGVVAGLVRTSLDTGKPLSQLSADELTAHNQLLGEHIEQFQGVLSQSSWLESKISEGGTSLARVREQLAQARSTLDTRTQT
jgi:argininosuccinate lyase